MKHLSPIELLKERLYEYEHALHKSFESFKKGDISGELHTKHKNNLQPKIFVYKQAINYLETWIDEKTINNDIWRNEIIK